MNESDSPESITDSGMTIDEYLRWLAPAVWQLDWKGKPLWKPWPADLFAISLSLLRRIGGYLNVVQQWPPTISPENSLRSWLMYVEELSLAWKNACLIDANIPVPTAIQDAWHFLQDCKNDAVSSILSNGALQDHLMLLVAVSDETFKGFLTKAFLPQEHDQFIQRACYLLTKNTLCSDIHPSRIRILPKVRVPQSGLTTRSLSQNLALCQGIEVSARWLNVPTDSFGKSPNINCLIVPYPFSINAKQFSPRVFPRMEMPEKFGYFSFTPTEISETDLANWIWELVSTAEETSKTSGDNLKVDLIVFPEAALTECQFKAINDFLDLKGSKAAIVAGISGSSKSNEWGNNQAIISYVRSIPVGTDEYVSRIDAKQAKHHRWSLDNQQINSYSDLGISLPTSENGIQRYWEGISIDSRQVNFLNFQNRFTLCVLVCEDLTRVEPVGELVRSVAPDLIIALLQDGPQIESRWPGKYGTVLADDPGSSVLTVSSAGMIRLSIEAYVKASREDKESVKKNNPNCSIALWKDSMATKGHEISLMPDDAIISVDETGKCQDFPNHAVLLSLTLSDEQMHTADGRVTMRKSLRLDPKKIVKVVAKTQPPTTVFPQIKLPLDGAAENKE